MFMKILENRQDLQVYKKLIIVASAYIDQYHGSAFAPVFDSLLKKGIKCLPRDAKALDILEHILTKQTTTAAKINELLNLRFSDLPTSVRPVFSAKPGHQETAGWKRGDRVYDRLMALINVEENGEAGQWTDVSGDPVKLITVKEN